MAYERFWAKVNKTDGCWLWTGAQTKGYGQLSFEKRHLYAHRFSWEIENGPIPPGMVICHRCDTPLCVRPDHLFLGSHADNQADMDAKGRRRTGRLPGEMNGNAKLMDRDIPDILDMWRSGLSIYRIAPLYGVSKSTIHNIVSGKYWRKDDDISAAR